VSQHPRLWRIRKAASGRWWVMNLTTEGTYFKVIDTETWLDARIYLGLIPSPPYRLVLNP
jgi:hypothetical protein